MAAKKQEFVVERKMVPCAGRSDCRFPGLLWFSRLGRNERLCINHYYTAMDQNPDLRHDPTAPPR